MTTLIDCIYFASAILLGYVFFAAAYHKLFNKDKFVQIIREYQIVPARTEQFSLYSLGLSEFFISILLLSAYSQYAALIAIGLLTLYTAAIARALLLDLKIKDCGCGLPGAENQVSSWMIARNLILILLAAFIAVNPIQASSSWIISIPLALFFILIYLIAGQINENKTKLNNLRDYSRG